VDNLTHTLVASAISQTGFNRKTRFATVTLIAAANLPDLDVIAWTGGTANYLKYHRGITHSILGVMMIGLLAGAAAYWMGRQAAPKKSAPPVHLRWLLLGGLIAAASHLLLDFTNAYGVRPFLPFSGRWYAWDIMFILDPVLLFLLVVGLGLPALLRLISEEVGARKPAYRAGAIFGLSAMALLWGLRDFAHRRVLAMLDSHNYQQEIPRRIGAFPSPANPFAWTGVVETDSVFHVLPANALDQDVDVQQTQVFRKPELSAPLEAALRTRTATIFLDFARFPWSQTTETTSGYAVSLRDLRFISTMSGRRGFVVDVELDKDLKVRSESFRFTAAPRRDDSQRPPEDEDPGNSPAGPAGDLPENRR